MFHNCQEPLLLGSASPNARSTTGRCAKQPAGLFLRPALRPMAHKEQPALKKQKCNLDMFDSSDFSDAAAVRALAAAGERLVCLQFPEGLGSLYCHSFALSSNSSVLRNVLEDTQQQDQQQGGLCTIPLAGDSDNSVWKLALGLIYRLKGATITLDNAQALMLLADKWDLPCISAEVERFLMSKDVPAADSRFSSHLTPSTVGSWLTVFSKCGFEHQAQMCIDYILGQETQVDIDMASLRPIHANMLLISMQRKLCKANSDIRQSSSRIRNAKSQRDKVAQHYGTRLEMYTCSSCSRRWIAGFVVNCCTKMKQSKVVVSLDHI